MRAGGVDDEDIYRAETPLDMTHQAGDFLFVAHIRLERLSRAAGLSNLFDDLASFLRAAVIIHCHPGAASPQLARNRGAEAPGCPGDQSHSSRKIMRHCRFLTFRELW